MTKKPPTKLTHEQRSKLATATNLKNWARPEYRARQMAGRNRPEVLAARSEALRKRLEDPVFREARSAAIKTPEFRAKTAARMRVSWKDPEFRKKMIDSRATAIQAAWDDPIKKAARLERHRATAKRKGVDKK